MDPTIKPSPLTRVCPACRQTYQPISFGPAPAHRCPQASSGAPVARDAIEQSEIYDELVGATLAERYYFERVLDKGGMGVVYAARHNILGTPLAIKVVRQRRGGESLQRFFREAQLASKLRHPNIVYIQDFGLLPGGLPYLVMEMVPGKTLAALIRQGPLDPNKACRIALQVARGMQPVHAAGIVHRGPCQKIPPSPAGALGGRGKGSGNAEPLS